MIKTAPSETCNHCGSSFIVADEEGGRTIGLKCLSCNRPVKSPIKEESIMGHTLCRTEGCDKVNWQMDRCFAHFFEKYPIADGFVGRLGQLCLKFNCDLVTLMTLAGYSKIQAGKFADPGYPIPGKTVYRKLTDTWRGWASWLRTGEGEIPEIPIRIISKLGEILSAVPSPKPETIAPKPETIGGDPEPAPDGDITTNISQLSLTISHVQQTIRVTDDGKREADITFVCKNGHWKFVTGGCVIGLDGTASYDDWMFVGKVAREIEYIQQNGLPQYHPEGI